MKIVILDGNTAIMDDYNYENLSRFGKVTCYSNTNHSDVLARVIDADIIITNKVEITSDIMDKCHCLKLITIQATGYNVVDVEHAKSLNIPVCNIPAYSSPSVAQHTLALMLEAANHVGTHASSTANGDWIKSTNFCYTLTSQIELCGKTIGLIGYGSIGRKVARICSAMGMNVIANNRSKLTDEYAKYATLETIYNNADIISLHCPQTADTDKIICKNSIEKMRDGVIIINTSRGGLVDEYAIKDALNCGKIYAYCADVLTYEPQDKNCPLIGVKNAIITPHIAWASHEARGRLLQILNDNIDGFLCGKIINSVNGL